MSQFIKEKDESGRTHLDSRFMRESLVDKDVLHSAVVENEVAILPYLNIINLGGKSIIDRGKEGVYPVLEELAELKGKHKFVVGVTGGVRVRPARSDPCPGDDPGCRRWQDRRPAAR